MKNRLNEEDRAMLWLNIMLGSITARITTLLETYDGSAITALEAASKNDIPQLKFIDGERREKMRLNANDKYIDKIIQRLDEMKIEVATLNSPNYPTLLKNIYDPPYILFYKGRLFADLKLPIAVIGAREPSDYGRRATFQIAKELASAGACVVSGMAYGLDRVAAEGALDAAENDYPTIAVLGTGPDVVYPSTGREVYEEIVRRGAVVSEFMPGTTPKPGNFPMRNRIISGLSRGVIVVEARERSGTAITVDCALEQGRDVFAVPGRIFDDLSYGTNNMIREGIAKITLSAEDVLEEYHITPREDAAKSSNISDLPYEQALIAKLLTAGERTFDELAELSKFDSGKLNSTLTEMEFSGIIKQSAGRLYSL